MAKTNFVNGNPSQGIMGTVVTAEFLNAVNNHRHRGLAEDGDGAIDYAVDTGTANNYAIALNPALTGYIEGMPIHFKAATTNTGASTLNINGLGAKPIKRNGGDLLADTIKAGQIVCVTYDGVNFQLVGGDALDGKLVQVVCVAYATYTTGTTRIPYDNTIPENTEGTEIFTATITPKAANNKLLVTVVVQCGVALGADTVTIALFKDSDLYANSACAVSLAAAGYMQTASLNYNMTAGTTSPITFKIRVGVNATTTAWDINGTDGSPKFNGASISNITIMEYLP